MKVEYIKSMLGFGQELHIPVKEFRKKYNNGAEFETLGFIVKSYVHGYCCRNMIVNSDLEAADSHIKKDGTIVLFVKQNEENVWCNICVVTEEGIIPVLTSDDGFDFTVNNAPPKAPERKERNRKQKEEGVRK